MEQRLVIRLAGLCAHARGYIALHAHYLCAPGLATLPGITAVSGMQEADLDLTDPKAVNKLAELRQALARAGIPLERFQDRCANEFKLNSWSAPPSDWAPRPHTGAMPMLDVMIREANADPTRERRDGHAVPRPVHLLTALLSTPNTRASAILADLGVARESALAGLREPDKRDD